MVRKRHTADINSALPTTPATCIVKTYSRGWERELLCACRVGDRSPYFLDNDFLELSYVATPLKIPRSSKFV
jgi:hypothetical protein